MIEAWRITKRRYAAQAFDGEGARRFGGRWSSVGHRAVYASESLALATLELLVHLESSALLGAYVAIPLRIPPRLVEQVRTKQLPEDWRSYPAPVALQRLGNAWLDSGKSAVLRVPSVIVPTEFNYLLNPGHKDFSKIHVGEARPFALDGRLLKRV